MQMTMMDEKQVQNSAGGFVFAVDDLTRLRRFLGMRMKGAVCAVSPMAMSCISFRRDFLCMHHAHVGNIHPAWYIHPPNMHADQVRTYC
jgi:hypothetical protein